PYDKNLPAGSDGPRDAGRSAARPDRGAESRRAWAYWSGGRAGRTRTNCRCEPAANCPPRRADRRRLLLREMCWMLRGRLLLVQRLDGFARASRWIVHMTRTCQPAPTVRATRTVVP